MGMFDTYKKKAGMFGQYGKTTSSTTIDLSDIDQLKSYAESKGLKIKEKGQSLFSKAVDVISRPLYASAGIAKALVKNYQAEETGGETENILEEAWKGLSGKEKETYSDVLKEAGVENKWLRGGVGFALDIALDPSTYFGGAVVKGVGKTLKATGKGALEVGRKFSPAAIESLEAAGSSLKDALGHAFVYGYKTTPGVSDEVAKYFNKLGIAKEDIVKTNFDALSKFDEQTLKEATDIMFKNKVAEKTLKEGGVASYIKPVGQTAEAVDEMKTIGKRIGELTGLPEEKIFENYIPSISNLEKRLKEASGLKVGNEGYLKKFENKIADEELLKKPIESYSRREFEVVRNNLTRETLNDLVATYGKQFKTIDEALEAGYKPIYEKGYAGLKLFKDEADKLPRFAGLKKPLGYLKADDWNFINNYLYPEMKTIDLLGKAGLGVLSYDGMTRLFKTAVTSYFPAFHIRNFLSGNIQNYSVLGREALNPVNHINGLGILKKTDRILNFPKWRGTGKELSKILSERFGSASRYISDLGNYIEEIGTKGFKVKSNIAKLDPRQIGNFIEMWQKSTATSAALRQGKSLDEALKLAEAAGFDYSKITKFESKIMRRLIPFYSFARKNAELQLKTLAQNPQRILNQIKFTKNLSEIFGGQKPTEEDLKGLPPWALAGLGFKIQGNRYLTSFGLPLEEFVNRVNKPINSTLTSLNPLVKYPLETEIGYNFFKGKQIKDLKSVDEGIAEAMPEDLKNWLGVKPYEYKGKTYYSADPDKLHLIENTPLTRLYSTLKNLKDTDTTMIDKIIGFATGAKIYNIDIELQKYFRERDLRQDIEDELLKTGDLKEFTKTYIPKN